MGQLPTAMSGSKTAATKKARQQQERELRYLEALKRRMREKPNDPDVKATLHQEFNGVSKRAFNELYGRAAKETGTDAWTKPGRRRGQRRD